MSEHVPGCLYGTYNPSTHDPFEVCTCPSKQAQSLMGANRQCVSKGLDKLELANALAEVEELKEKLARAERDRDEYQAQVHTLTARASMMTSAASSAAASTVTAIERIQEMEKIVTAAEDWTKGGPHAALTDAVNAWQKYKKTWS